MIVSQYRVLFLIHALIPLLIIFCYKKHILKLKLYVHRFWALEEQISWFAIAGDLLTNIDGHVGFWAICCWLNNFELITVKPLV